MSCLAVFASLRATEVLNRSDEFASVSLTSAPNGIGYAAEVDAAYRTKKFAQVASVSFTACSNRCVSICEFTGEDLTIACLLYCKPRCFWIESVYSRLGTQNAQRFAFQPRSRIVRVTSRSHNVVEFP